MSDVTKWEKPNIAKVSIWYGTPEGGRKKTAVVSMTLAQLVSLRAQIDEYIGLMAYADLCHFELPVSIRMDVIEPFDVHWRAKQCSEAATKPEKTSH